MATRTSLGSAGRPARSSRAVSVRYEPDVLARLDRLVARKRLDEPSGSFSRTTLARAAVLRLLESEGA